MTVRFGTDRLQGQSKARAHDPIRRVRLMSLALVLTLGWGAVGPDAQVVHGAADAIRPCAYMPGTEVDVPARPPGGHLEAARPRPTLPDLAAGTAVSPWTTARQRAILQELVDAVEALHPHVDALDADWERSVETGARYVRSGLDDEAFEQVLSWLLEQLGDEHSRVVAPDDTRAEAALIAGAHDYVGIGVLTLPLADDRGEAVVAVLQGGQAEAAGVRPRDLIVAVDGGPLNDARGHSRLLGERGSAATLTLRRAGEPERHVVVIRDHVTGGISVDACVFAGTRIGYVHLPTLYDETTVGQVHAVLKAMTAAGPLDGLILDVRVNSGGVFSVLLPLLDTFASGEAGAWQGRDWSETMSLYPVDVGGSQDVPLVVLVGRDTESFAEILAGALQRAGRATLVGMPTRGNVETTAFIELPGGWTAWISQATFQPTGGVLGEWEGTGVAPDIVVPARWYESTEATDPAIAAAVEHLGK